MIGGVKFFCYSKLNIKIILVHLIPSDILTPNKSLDDKSKYLVLVLVIHKMMIIAIDGAHHLLCVGRLS